MRWWRRLTHTDKQVERRSSELLGKVDQACSLLEATLDEVERAIEARDEMYGDDDET